MLTKLFEKKLCKFDKTYVLYCVLYWLEAFIYIIIISFIITGELFKYL